MPDDVSNRSRRSGARRWPWPGAWLATLAGGVDPSPVAAAGGWRRSRGHSMTTRTSPTSTVRSVVAGMRRDRAGAGPRAVVLHLHGLHGKQGLAELDPVARRDGDGPRPARMMARSRAVHQPGDRAPVAHRALPQRRPRIVLDDQDERASHRPRPGRAPSVDIRRGHRADDDGDRTAAPPRRRRRAGPTLSGFRDPETAGRSSPRPRSIAPVRPAAPNARVPFAGRSSLRKTVERLDRSSERRLRPLRRGNALAGGGSVQRSATSRSTGSPIGVGESGSSSKARSNGNVVWMPLARPRRGRGDPSQRGPPVSPTVMTWRSSGRSPAAAVARPDRRIDGTRAGRHLPSTDPTGTGAEVRRSSAASRTSIAWRAGGTARAPRSDRVRERFPGRDVSCSATRSRSVTSSCTLLDLESSVDLQEPEAAVGAKRNSAVAALWSRPTVAARTAIAWRLGASRSSAPAPASPRQASGAGAGSNSRARERATSPRSSPSSALRCDEPEISRIE